MRSVYFHSPTKKSFTTNALQWTVKVCCGAAPRRKIMEITFWASGETARRTAQPAPRLMDTFVRQSVEVKQKMINLNAKKEIVPKDIMSARTPAAVK